MVYCMKTTVDIPDDLMIQAKKRAIELRRPFRELVIEGLQARLDRHYDEKSKPGKGGIRWVFHEGGLPPDVNVSDRSKMTEWLQSGK